MKISFRKYHLLRILDLFEESSYPIDLFLKNYFRSHKQIGSKDRKEICETLYPMIRFKGLIDYFSKKPFTSEQRLETYLSLDSLIASAKLPHHLKVSFPKDYFSIIEKNYGLEKALEICNISNTQAPTTVRVNTLKTTRDKLFSQWKKEYSVYLGKHSNQAISFGRKINFFGLPEFKEGLFEIQDEGSQLIGDLVEAKPKDHVLDYCSGSGGKTLCFAPKMEGKGQIYLHDIRTKVLIEAKKRLKRAGIQNAQILEPNKKIKRYHGKMDWVLTDVPCSGSGTLRRNPDMKWRFSPQMVDNLVIEQRDIFAKALKFVKSKGFIVYATCSLFPEENEQQIKYFLNNHPLKLCKMTSWLPEKHGMDGFFGAVFQLI